jgi:hypothetical protein
MCDNALRHGWHDDGTHNNPEVAAPPTQLSFEFSDWRCQDDCDCEYGDASTDELASVRRGDPRFLALLDDIEKLHADKQADYGRSNDPFANVRASEEWGVSPWIGALIRATDKVRRLQTFANKGELINEGVEDSLMDLAVYALIALVLFREEQPIE